MLSPDNVYGSSDYMPFHPGEVSIQKQAHVHEKVMQYAPKIIRPFMPQQHIDFYVQQPFLVAGVRDEYGDMWTTFFMPKPSLTSAQVASSFQTWITSPSETTLQLQSRALPSPNDALYNVFHPATSSTPEIDVGILGIDFSTRRRNRVNGRLRKIPQNSSTAALPTSNHEHPHVNKVDMEDDSAWTFQVDQSFGNCPQYIQPRTWTVVASNALNEIAVGDSSSMSKMAGAGISSSSTSLGSPVRPRRPSQLNSDQINLIHQAETLFVSTGYRAEGEDARYGNDVSHRGGPPGFVHVEKDGMTLILPEFKGNDAFNSLGNLVLDPRMGISFPEFETGGMLQLTGTAIVDMNVEKASKRFPGALRIVTFTISGINHMPPSTFPLRWTTEPVHERTRELVISSKVEEAKDIISFHLQPSFNDGQRTLWPYRAGQHIPITLRTKDGGTIDRTYSLSSRSPLPAKLPTEYRISVRRAPMGLASNLLHDDLQVGDTILVHTPAGDFGLDRVCLRSRPVLLMSTGVGITPILSMLHELVDLNDREPQQTPVIWIHGAQDELHHAFREEVSGLIKRWNNFIPSGDTIDNSMSPTFANATENRSPLLAYTVYSRQEHPIASNYIKANDVNYEIQRKAVSMERILYNRRIDALLVAAVLQESGAGQIQDMDIYLCGTESFAASMEELLIDAYGVDSRHFHHESF